MSHKNIELIFQCPCVMISPFVAKYAFVAKFILKFGKTCVKPWLLKITILVNSEISLLLICRINHHTCWFLGVLVVCTGSVVQINTISELSEPRASPRKRGLPKTDLTPFHQLSSLTGYSCYVTDILKFVSNKKSFVFHVTYKRITLNKNCN